MEEEEREEEGSERKQRERTMRFQSKLFYLDPKSAVAVYLNKYQNASRRAGKPHPVSSDMI
jgi:hypothetical protein